MWQNEAMKNLSKTEAGEVVVIVSSYYRTIVYICCINIHYAKPL